MGFHEIIKEKKEWQAHMARVKALPKDYQIVYKEIQKYVFKASTVEPQQIIELLYGIVNLFEESTAVGKSALEVTGTDVAAFCDGLM